MNTWAISIRGFNNRYGMAETARSRVITALTRGWHGGLVNRLNLA